MTRADELAEQIAVLYGWAPIHADTDREKALNRLWHEWADERGGYLTEHAALTDERIVELARQYDERHDAFAALVSAVVVEEPRRCRRHDWYQHNTPCYGVDGEIYLLPGTVHCRRCFRVKGSRAKSS